MIVSSETATLADVRYLQARLVSAHGEETVQNGAVEMQEVVIDIVAARTGPVVRCDAALAKTPDNAVNTAKEEAEVLEQGGAVEFELGEKHGVTKATPDARQLRVEEQLTEGGELDSRRE